ncbi:ATP-binding protein [Desertivirga arenae]|uniref:ATP-binding protein n=1 Tax=Desertivirga arenae TaxID=2810309 RepID=UPI001A974346|nr:ATP-binding protein [Pedobacter sp. SYSU D00823]
MKNLLSDPLFLALFNSPVPRIIIQADAPLFTIVISNDAHKIVTNLVGREIDGKSVWEIFDPTEAGGDGGNLLRDALTEAQTTNKTVLMPPFRYDMSSRYDEGMEEKWWQLEIMPVGGNSPQPEFLLATTLDITEQVLKQRAIENRGENLVKLNTELEETVSDRNKELQASELKFRNLVEQSPIAITLLTGSDFIIDLVNKEMLSIWGNPEDVIGRPIIEVLPGLEGTSHLAAFDHVYKSGLPYYGKEIEILLRRNGVLENGYFNIINYPVKGPEGAVEGIIVSAIEVTELVLARRRVEESERLLHSLIMAAHYPLMVLQGNEWIIQIANKPLAELWGMSLENIIGLPLLQVLPELKDQPFPALLKNVFDTGLSYGQEEEVFYLETPEGRLTKYVSFYYDALFDEQGKVAGIIVSANDITAQVSSRKELEKAYEQANLSKQAAQLGTFDMDLLAGTMEWDARCRELFGISHNNEVNYNVDFVKGLHEEDRDRVQTLIDDLFTRQKPDGDYDVEYRTVGAEDGKVRWVRAKGKVFFDDTNTAVRFIGSVLDITSQKLDEQRKNDFIGMVSHELKTPLTTLKANIQLLSRKARTKSDPFYIWALDKSEKQVDKMKNMIYGFLNLSRLESGKLFLDLKEVDLNRLILDEINSLLSIQERERIRFRNWDDIKVKADPDKISHVLSNLISNAIKYSPKGGSIEVESRTEGDEAIVSVKDEGIGIEKKDLDKLFDRYYRVKMNSTEYISGFGIGLYLSSEIVSRHNGRIWVESEVDKGSTFFFSLPLN